MDKPTYTLISAHFTDRNFKACTAQIDELLKLAGKDVTNPMIGVYVFRPRGPAFWVLSDLCDYLQRAEIPFVRVDHSTPLSGSLTEAGQKALADMGVEFWNKV